MNQITIKIHDIMHEGNADYNIEKAESYIENSIYSFTVDVRIASGAQNSPIFITVNANMITLKTAKRLARQATSSFTEFVDGVNVDNTITDSNIKIKA
jgi:hypothetical protein